MDEQITRFLRVYGPGQTIFADGSQGDAMYVLQDGSVDIRKGPVLLATLAPGEIFGEMALVDASPRSADAVAGPDGANVLAVDNSHFIYLVSQQPAFALVVLGVMARRLRASNAA